MNPRWFDTHVHSQFSADTHTSMREQAREALRLGLAGLAFTDHVEWYPEDETYHFLNPADYFAELEATRAQVNGQLTLLAGLEIGNPQRFPLETAQLLETWPWDFVLGSAHWVGHQRGWVPDFFADGAEAAYRRYFDELLDLARHGDFDILAHLDIVRRDDWELNRRALPLEGFADVIRAVLRALIERGKGLEINTSGLAKGMGMPLPDRTVLRWYRELGGEILVFGSDAHSPQRLAADFAAARELALSVGFARLARFSARQVTGWIPLA